MRKKRVFLITGAAVVALVVLAGLVFSSGTEVETVKAESGDIISTVTDSGYLQPVTNYDIHATQTARVVRVLVETGQAIRQGDTLLTLENLDLAAQISEVQAQLSQTQTTIDGAVAAVERTQLELQDAQESLARLQQLYQAGAISQVELTQAQLQVDTIQQNLREQQASADNALAQKEGLQHSLQQYAAKEQQLVVRSPVDGIVSGLPVKQEQVLLPGDLMVGVAIPEQLEIKADILSDDLAHVEVGQKVIVTAPVLGERELVGEVKQIYPRAEEKQSALGILQRRVPVIISLPDLGNLKDGYEVKVAIETMSRREVVILPREAVRTGPDGQKEVMVLVDRRVRHRLVETGLNDQSNIEIISGLSVGDEVIRDGGMELKENAKVKPTSRS